MYLIDCHLQLVVRRFVRVLQPRYFACKFFAQFTQVSVDYCIRRFVCLFCFGKFLFDICFISVNRFSQIAYRFIEVRLYLFDCGFQLAVRFFVRFFQPRYFACKFFAQFTKVSVDYCIRIFVRLFRRGKFAFDIRLIVANRFS